MKLRAQIYLRSDSRNPRAVRTAGFVVPSGQRQYQNACLYHNDVTIREVPIDERALFLFNRSHGYAPFFGLDFQLAQMVPNLESEYSLLMGLFTFYNI